MDIANTIKFIRETKGWTLRYLGERSQVGASRLCEIENHRVNIGMIIFLAVAEAFEMHPAFLMLASMELKDIPTEKREAFKKHFPELLKLLTKMTGQDIFINKDLLEEK